MDTATIITAIGIVVLLGVQWAAYRLKVAPVPTMPRIRRAVIGLVPPGARHIAELGAGWGGMTRALAKIAPVTAFEASYLPYLVSRLRGHDVKRADFFTADLSGYDVVYCYLSPAHMARLGPKLAVELKPGATIISNAFAIPGWQPAHMVTIGSYPAIPVYVYTIGHDQAHP